MGLYDTLKKYLIEIRGLRKRIEYLEIHVKILEEENARLKAEAEINYLAGKYDARCQKDHDNDP